MEDNEMNAMFIALLLSQIQQAPPPPQAPPVIEKVNPPKAVQSKHQSYADATVQAIKNNLPLVTFVGFENPRHIKGAMVCAVKTAAFKECPDYCIVIGIPDSKGGLQWTQTLHEDASDDEIKAAIQPKAKAVQPLATPFSSNQSSNEQEPVADDDMPEAVASIIDGLERYRTARLTQVSGNRSGRAGNWAVNRSSVGEKWVVPGGLEGVRGWTNQLYRNPRNRVRNWFDRADPNDTYRTTDGEIWGSEFIYQRSYDDGAKFADVLRTPNGIFEVRVAEKKDGKWERSVPYRDLSVAPEGYTRVSLQACASCHNQAGDGVYGGPRIPGGDSIISAVLSGVEN
jgi:hypothetical protein